MIDLGISEETANGANAYASPVQWQQIAARLPIVSPTTALSVRVQLAARITAAVSERDAPVVRLELSAADLALVEAAAEGA